MLILTDTVDILVSPQDTKPGETSFQLALDYDPSALTPSILPPLLQRRTVVTSPIASIVDQLAFEYLLITPLAQPLFLGCFQMGREAFL